MGSGGKGSTGTGTQYGSSSVSIPPEIAARYGDVWNRATTAADAPFKPYDGSFVAPTNARQEAGYQTIAQAGGNWGGYIPMATQQVGQAQAGAQPYLNAAGGNLTDALSQGQGLSAASLSMGSGAYGGAQPWNAMAGQQVNSAYGNTQPYNSTAAGLAGAGTAAVNAGPLDSSSFMSPYQSQVISATMAQLGQMQQRERNDQRDQMIMGGSWGGDRGGIANAALAGQQDLASASTLAGLNQANYAQALAAAQQQQGVQLGAGQANRAAIQQGAGMFADLGNTQFNQGLGAANANLGVGQQQYGQGMGLAGLYGNTGQQIYGMGTGTAQAQQGLGLAGYQMGANTADAYARYGGQGFNQQIAGGQAILGAGTLQQQTDQADLSARYNQFLQQQGYPFQTAQFLSNIATGSGPLYGSQSSSSAGQFQPQPFFSDERVKENIKEIGRTHDGQPIIKFNYRGDNQPQIGLSAQETEKHHPDAVGEYAGIKTVDYDAATKDAERVKRDLGGAALPTMDAILANQKTSLANQTRAPIDITGSGLGGPGGKPDPTKTPMAPPHGGGLLGAAMGLGDMGSANGATGAVGAGSVGAAVGEGGNVSGGEGGTVGGTVGGNAGTDAGVGDGTYARGGRTGFAEGGAPYGINAGMSPYGDTSGLLMAHNAMYGGMNSRGIPGMGGAGGSPQTGIVPVGAPQRTPKLLTPQQQAQQPARMQQTGLGAATSGLGDVMGAGKSAGDAYSAGKDALVGSKGTKDNPEGTGGLFGKGGKWDYEGGWVDKNLGGIFNGSGQQPGYGGAGGFGDIDSEIADWSRDGVYARGGRAARASGGAMPYGGVSILPEELYDPEHDPTKLPTAELPKLDSGGGSGGQKKDGTGKAIGSLAGGIAGSYFGPIGTMVGSSAGGMLGGLFKKGGRVGFADGGSGTGGFGEIPLDAVLDPTDDRPKPWERPFTGLRNEPVVDLSPERIAGLEAETVPSAKPDYGVFGPVHTTARNTDGSTGGGLGDITKPRLDPPAWGPGMAPAAAGVAQPPDIAAPPAAPAGSAFAATSGPREPGLAPAAAAVAPPAAAAPAMPAPQAVGPVPGSPNPDAPRSLAQRIRGVESGDQHWDPQTGAPKRGRDGEVGVGQIMPGTGPIAARDAGLPWNEELFYRRKTGDPAKDQETENYHRALSEGHVKALSDRYGGDEAKVAAAYNAGAGAVDKAIARSGDRWLSDPAIPDSTRGYIAKVAGGVNSAGGGDGVMSLNGGKPNGLQGAVDAAGTNPAPVPGQGGFGAANPSAMSLWGKATDWMDRNERYIVPGLSFLGNMLASPSRTLAGSIGTGLAAAAPLYANLGQRQQGMEISRAQAETGRLSQQTTERAQLIGVLAQLQQRQANLMKANGGQPDPALANQIAALQTKIVSGGGFSPSPSPGGSAPGRADLTPAGAPVTSAPQGPVRTDGAPAASPAPPAAVPAPASADRWAIPELQPPDYSKVDDDWNPEKLKEKAKNIARETGEDPQPLMDKARAAQERFNQTGELPAKGGGTVRSPNWENVQQARANIPTNKESTLQEQQAAVARQDARRQINAMRGVLENYESGTWNDVKSEIAGKLRSVGLAVPESATVNPQAFQEFLKGAYTNMLNTASTQKGAATDNLRSEIAHATPNPDLQPGANRKILGQMSAALDQADKHYTDWSKQVEASPATNRAVWYDQWQKKPENNLETLTEKAIKGTPVLGDAPKSYTDVQEGKQYILRPAEAKQLGYDDEQIKRAFGDRKTIKVIGTKNGDGKISLQGVK